MGQGVEIKCAHAEIKARKWTACSGGAEEDLMKSEMMKVCVSVTSGV